MGEAGKHLCLWFCYVKAICLEPGQVGTRLCDGAQRQHPSPQGLCPGRTQGHACPNQSSPCKPGTCISQVQFVSHKLIKANRFVLLFTETPRIFCLCLSRSACFEEQAAGAPQVPASRMQPGSPCGHWWPSLHPTQGLSWPHPHQLMLLALQEHPGASSLPVSIRADIRHTTQLSASPLQSQP